MINLVKKISQVSGSGPIIVRASFLFFDKWRVDKKLNCQIQFGDTGLGTSSSFVFPGMQAVLLIFQEVTQCHEWNLQVLLVVGLTPF